MPRILKIPNANNCVRLYQSGMSVIDVSVKTGIHWKRLRRLFFSKNIIRTRSEALTIAHIRKRSNWIEGMKQSGLKQRIIKDEAPVIREYLSGISEIEMSRRYKVSRTVIRGILIRNKTPIRGGSEAELLKWSAIKKDRKLIERQCSGMWNLRRGQRDSIAVKIARAKSFYKGTLRVGRYESEIASALRTAGFSVQQQYPCHIYNLDLTLHPIPVAVEIQSSNHFKSFSSIRPERLEYILDHGYAVLIVYIPMHSFGNIPMIAKQTVAFAKLVRRDKSLISHYGMIGRDGQPVTPLRFNPPRRPRIKGF